MTSKFIGKEISVESTSSFAYKQGKQVLKIIGVGGAGGNAVNFMANSGVKGVDFIAINTDAQALSTLKSDNYIQLGEEGLGAGADPKKGKETAKKSSDKIKDAIKGANMIFIAAGMGGGTGTGAAPIVAQIAREMGILTVGVVSTPFKFERRNKVAEEGLSELSEHVHSLITVPNDKLMEILGREASLTQTFEHANGILCGAVRGISDLLTTPGFINADFEDLSKIMHLQGMAMIGVGQMAGDDRAIHATKKALFNPLLEDVCISNAKGLLVNITSGPDISLGEFYAVGETIEEYATDGAEVIIGTAIDENMKDELRVTVVATGLNEIYYKSTDSVASTKTSPLMAKTSEVTKGVNLSKHNENTASNSINNTERKYIDKNNIRKILKVSGGLDLKPGDTGYLDIPTFLRNQKD